MKTKHMGRTGLKVSEICLGTMTFGLQCDEPTSVAIMDTALEFGVDFFDTSDAYPLGGNLGTIGRTEEIIGRWLKGRREKIVLATKCFVPTGKAPNQSGLSRKHIFEAVEGSLRRLQTDPSTPIDETMRALDDLVHQGKVRYLGCSNYMTWMLANALWTSDKLGLARFDCVQPRYNLLYREIEHELLPLCRSHGVGVIAYNPIAGGFLSGKYKPDAPPPSDTRFGSLSGWTRNIYHGRYWHEAQFESVSHLQDFFTKRNRSLVQAAIAWVLAQPVITSAIVGASSAAQLRESLPATEVTLEQEEMEACNDIWFVLPRLRDPAVALR
jgi:1-deoxyxylulose-5-phosphate synthase